MIKRILPLAILGAAIISNTGCSTGGSDGFKKTHGIEYKIIKDVPGKTAAKGDIVEFNIIAKADTTELANTYKQGKPGMMRVDSVRNSGDLQAVFPMLSAGDSAVVTIATDTIIKTIPAGQLAQAQQMQPWLKKGKKVTITISVVSIKSMEEMQTEKKAKEAKQMSADDQLMKDYFAKNNIKAEKTPTGLYYTIQNPGSGAKIEAGQTVSMMYTGKTLDGKAFDSNVDTSIGHHGNTPLTFHVGAHQMIAGVDEGVALLKKGSKATLYLPSPLGYGENAPPNIGPNAVLVFEVNITDVKAGGNDPQPMPGGGQPQ